MAISATALKALTAKTSSYAGAGPAKGYLWKTTIQKRTKTGTKTTEKQINVTLGEVAVVVGATGLTVINGLVAVGAYEFLTGRKVVDEVRGFITGEPVPERPMQWWEYLSPITWARHI